MRRWSLRCWETKSNIRSPRGPWSPKYVWEKIYQRSGTLKSIENWRSVRRRGPWKQRERCVAHCSAIGQPGPRIRTWGLQVPFRRKLYTKTNEIQFINEFTVVLKQAYTQKCAYLRETHLEAEAKRGSAGGDWALPIASPFNSFLSCSGIYRFFIGSFWSFFWFFPCVLSYFVYKTLSFSIDWRCGHSP